MPTIRQCSFSVHVVVVGVPCLPCAPGVDSVKMATVM